MHGDDEDEEWRRQQRELARLPLVDRLHGTPKRTTVSGFTDQRSYRRTGRVVQLPIRVHPKSKAIVDALLRRDNHASMVALFEAMLETYQKVRGPVDPASLPSDEDLVRQIERERRLRDG